jgi:hypothetical protein
MGKNQEGVKIWQPQMGPNLESKVLQSVSDTGLVLEPASGLD